MTVDFVVHGRAITMYLPDGDDPVQEKIRNRRGFSEAELLEDIRARVKPGDLVVDIRAHVGNHAVYLAAVAGAQVLAFEPQAGPFAILQRNVELNGLQEQVTAVNRALGRLPGTTLDEQVGERR